MNRHLLVSVACFTCLLCSCAAPGLRYSEHPLVHADLSPDEARIAVLRPNESRFGSNGASRVHLDGDVFGVMGKGAYLLRDVPAGVHTLVAERWGAPGRCVWQDIFEGGRRYYFVVAPIPPSALEVVLGPFAQVSKKVGAVANLVLAAGSAANPLKVQCDGAFSIAPLDAGMLGAVEELREGK